MDDDPRQLHALRAHIAAIMCEDWQIVCRDPLTLRRGNVRWVVRLGMMVSEP